MVKHIIKLFDNHVLFWENPKIIKTISSFFVLVFISCAICSFLVYHELISIGRFKTIFKHRFFAIEAVLPFY